MYLRNLAIGGLLGCCLALSSPAEAKDCVAFFPSTANSCPDGDAENTATVVGWSFCTTGLAFELAFKEASEAASRGETVFSAAGAPLFGIPFFVDADIVDFADMMLDEMEVEKKLQVSSETNNRSVPLAPGQSKTETFLCFDPDQLERFLVGLKEQALFNAGN